MVDFLTEPVSHEEARKFIAGKTVVSKRVFDNMLPELRGKAFVVSGVEDAGLVQRIRDRIADLPQGGDWDEIREEIAADLTPFFVDPHAGGDVMAKQIEAAERRAELLVRTHGFQAYAATRYQEQVANTDIQPFWQYRAFGDGRVRESHQALDGVVLPADDPFWKDHYPPWEFGCRCIVIGLSPEAVEEIRAEDQDKAPDERRVIEGEFLKALHERKTLMRGPNKVVDVRSPVDKAEGAAGQNLAYRWNPGELTPDLAQLKGRYSPQVWAEFERFAKATDVGDGRTVWEWAGGSGERRAKSGEGKESLAPAWLERLVGGKVVRNTGHGTEADARVAELDAKSKGLFQAMDQARKLPTAQKDVRLDDLNREFLNSNFPAADAVRGALPKGPEDLLRAAAPVLRQLDGVGLRLSKAPQLSWTDELRPSADGQGNIWIPQAANPAAVARYLAHELAHLWEMEHPQVGRRAAEFHRRRIGKEAPVRLAEAFPGRGFGPEEIAYRDEFLKLYMGKVYADGTTEIISMGIQQLLTEPLALLRRDPDYFAFLMGVLQ